MRTSLSPDQRPVRNSGFVTNVLWNWVGTLITLVVAFFLSPLLVRKLGESDYGLWIVAAGLMEYYWLLDLGMRAAIIRFTSHHNALGEIDQLNEALNTAAAYNLLLVPLMIGGAWFGSSSLGQWMHVQNPLFPALFFAVSLCWSLSSLFNIFTSCLEGLQRFDVINKSIVINQLVRSVCIFTALMLGYGVLVVGYITVGSQILLHLTNLVWLWYIFPGLRFKLRYVSWHKFRELIGYGIHGVISSIGQRIQSQSPQMMLTYFLSERYAGYYGNPRMLLDYTADIVMRMGNVSNPRAAQLMADNRKEEVRSLAVRVNRFSLALFLPLAIFLVFYGQDFLTVWIKKPDFAAQAAPVLVALLGGYTLGIASQYSCQSVLFGVSRHQLLGRSLLVEALLGVAGMALLIPHYGLAAAAWWNSALLLLNRGVFIPWQLTQALETSFWGYMTQVYRPVVAAMPVLALTMLLHRFLPGQNWLQLITAGMLVSLCYLPLAYLSLPEEDRTFVRGHLERSLRALPFWS